MGMQRLRCELSSNLQALYASKGLFDIYNSGKFNYFGRGLEQLTGAVRQ
jgi:hypothetical protein